MIRRFIYWAVVCLLFGAGFGGISEDGVRLLIAANRAANNRVRCIAAISPVRLDRDLSESYTTLCRVYLELNDYEAAGI